VQAMWTVVYDAIDKSRESELWLNPSIFEWPASIGQLDVHEIDSVVRAYELHSHAEKRLTHAETALDRVDVVGTLKRSIDHRVRLLDSIYDLQSIPITSKPRRKFDILAYFGVARPLMVAELWKIRNAVEHEDADPPTVEELHRFLDLTWYFLRSTDHLVLRSATGLLFELGHGIAEPGFEIEIEPRKWTLALTGRLDRDLVSRDPVPGWTLSRGTADPAEPDDEDPSDANRLWVIAIINGSDAIMERVVRVALGGSFE
jgi:hypothetical protein